MPGYRQQAYVELHVDVEYDFERGYPERRYLANGDPGYPGEPDHCALTGVYVGGIDILDKLTDKERETLMNQLDAHVDDEPEYERNAA